MAFSVLKFILFLAINLCTAHLCCGVEEVVVIHAPESIKFLSNEPLRSSFLGDIFSSMLGYTIRSNIEWNGLAAVVPWRTPRALVVLELLGFDESIDLPLDGEKFQLEDGGDFNGQYDLIAHRTEERYFGQNPVMINMDLSDELLDSKMSQPVLLKSVLADPRKRLELAMSDPELGELLRKSTFNVSLPCDVKLLTEIATLKEFLKAVSSHKSELHDKTPDIYWLKLSGLDPAVSYYGPDSLQSREALRLLRQMVAEVARTMRSVYDDNVVVTVIKARDFSPGGHKGRRLLETTEAPSEKGLYNLAATYDPMFPVVFIIFVFIFLLLVLSILAIAIAMWNMDPGRDSIIYRMTSQRIKKE